ncbi:FAD-binding oxidoreductase [Micromonospora sp. NPDC049679]|uniref:FAD-binding oxidoreductase n=1 Tax=Micromonospora sp. NPDC049679 TaxID=3155920 RepID=UPI0033E01A90
MTRLGQSWATVSAAADQAACQFCAAVQGCHRGLPVLIPPGERGELFAALGQLAARIGTPATRAALRTVLARVHRRAGLLPAHYVMIGEALLETLRYQLGPSWTPTLTEEWKRAYQSASLALIRAAADAGDGGPAWWPAEVVGHQRPATGIAILTVRPEPRLPFRPGQAIPLHTERRPGQWRWYSPANAPRPDETIELHVRAVDGGQVSGALVHDVRPGEIVRLGPAAGRGLTLDGPPRRDLLLIAGGTGLAPLRALVEQLAAGNPADRRITLVVGARTLDELYDSITLDALQRAHPWLTMLVAFSDDAFVRTRERGTATWMALTRGRWDDHDVYVCGPEAMVADARARLTAAGVPADQVYLPDAFEEEPDGDVPQ